MASEVEIDPADTLPDVFSIHHFVWLCRNGYLPDMPYSLGPFPLTLDFKGTGKFDARIQRDLTKWGVISDDKLDPVAESMFTAITGACSWSVSGIVFLYTLKTNAREEFIAKHGQDDVYGIRHAVRDVPRVPFIAAVTEEEIVTAIVSPPAMIFNRIPRKGDEFKQVGNIIRMMLDPEENWDPWPGPRISVPYSTVRALAEDPETGQTVEDADARATQVDKVKKALRGMDTGSSTVNALGDLVNHPLTAGATLIMDMQTTKGTATSSVGIGVSFFDGAGEVVSYPVGKHANGRVIYYAPADDAGFADALKSLAEITEYEAYR